MGYRRMAGYQPELVCLLSWLPTDKVPVLTDIAVNSTYGLYAYRNYALCSTCSTTFLFRPRLVFGLENGLVVVDFLSKSILMNMATGDLYGTMDPFQRATSSPKRRGPSNDSNHDDASTFSYEYQVKHLPPSNRPSFLDHISSFVSTNRFPSRLKLPFCLVSTTDT